MDNLSRLPSAPSSPRFVFAAKAEDHAMLFSMEPSFATAPELQGVLAELAGREPIFHRPEFGMTRADF